MDGCGYIGTVTGTYIGTSIGIRMSADMNTKKDISIDMWIYMEVQIFGIAITGLLWRSKLFPFSDYIIGKTCSFPGNGSMSYKQKICLGFIC